MANWIGCVTVCHHFGPRSGARGEINQRCVTGRCWLSWFKFHRCVVSSCVEILWVHGVIRQLAKPGGNNTECSLHRVELFSVVWVSYYPACLRTFNALVNLFWCQHYCGR